MKIIEHNKKIEVFFNDDIFIYSKPDYTYDYINLVKILISLNIYSLKIGVKNCYIETNIEKYNILKTIFNIEKIDDFNYRIIILNEYEYEKYKITIDRMEKLKRIIG